MTQGEGLAMTGWREFKMAGGKGITTIEPNVTCEDACLEEYTILTQVDRKPTVLTSDHGV